MPCFEYRLCFDRVGHCKFIEMSSGFHRMKKTNSIEDDLELYDRSDFVNPSGGPLGKMPQGWVNRVDGFFNSTPILESQEDIRSSSNSQVEIVHSMDIDEEPPTPGMFKMMTLADFGGMTINESVSGSHYGLRQENEELVEEITRLQQQVQELTAQNRNLIELERATKAELLFFRKKAEHAKAQGGQLEYVAKQAKMRAEQAENLLSTQKREIEELHTSIQKIGCGEGGTKEEIEGLKKLIAKLEVSLVVQRNGHAEQMQQQARKHQEEVEQVMLNFSRAKKVGQEQIDQLVLQLQRSQERESELRLKIHQQIRQQQSTSMVFSKIDTDQKLEEPASVGKSFVGRFRNFEEMIESKLQPTTASTKKVLFRDNDNEEEQSSPYQKIKKGHSRQGHSRQNSSTQKQRPQSGHKLKAKHLQIPKSEQAELARYDARLDHLLKKSRQLESEYGVHSHGLMQ